MVAGQAPGPALPYQVGPAVPHMADVQPVAAHDRGRHRRAHPCGAQAGGPAEQPGIGRFYPLAEAPRYRILRPVELFVYRLEGERARQLPVGEPSHPVRQGPEQPPFEGQAGVRNAYGVLILLSDRTRLAEAAELYAWSNP